MSSPLRISIFDKDFAPLDWVGRPLSVDVIPRLDKASTASIVLDSDDDQIGQLVTQGSRLVIEYLADPTAPTVPTFLISGVVDERTGVGGAMGTRTFGLIDDWLYVMSMIGYPNPGGTLAQQGDDGTNYVLTASAETCVKTLVHLNATRLGLPITCATDLHRGATITVSVRMVPLLDVLYPAVTQAGIGVTAQQVGTGIVVDCFTLPTLTDTLTEASGVVTGGTWTQHAPTVTRVLEAGGGSGTARTYRAQISTAAESEWGIVREATVDCTGAADDAAMDAKGLETLGGGAATSTVSCTLAETRDFRAFISVHLGDSVPIQLAGAPVITGLVTEIEVAMTAPDGLLITPRVGDVNTTFAAQVTSAIAAVAARQRITDMGR